MGSQDKPKAKVIDHEDDDDVEANQNRNSGSPNPDVLNGVVSIAPPELAVGETSGIAASEVMKKTESGDESVIIVEEQETVKTIKAKENVQMGNNIVLRTLLRGPRYFDPPDSGRESCFNCGVEGHVALNCTAAKRKKPCYVCGGLGHNAKRCTNNVSLGQNCFLCNKGGHRAKDCPEKHGSASKSLTICLKCGNSGHDMFSCGNDYQLDDLEEIQCYVCKRFGHLYCANTEDTRPREISCYKCGRLGHTGLACLRFQVETTGAATPGLCYKCGQEGHFARECMFQVCPRFRVEITGAANPGSCYKCGQEGHFARECIFQARKRVRELSNTKTKRSYTEDDYMGYMSAPHHMGKTQKKKRPLMEERGFTTPKKSKNKGGWMTDHYTEERGFTTPKKKSRGGWMADHYTEEEGFSTPKKHKSRGGWMTEHPADFSPSKSKRSSWKSTGTPSIRSPNTSSYSSGSHTPRSKSSIMWNGHDGTSKSQGSAKAPHIRFSVSRSGNSASRFGNSNSDGHRKSYNWW